MKVWNRLLAWLVGALTVIATMITVASSVALGQGRVEEPLRSQNSAAQARQTEAYWTSERLAKARAHRVTTDFAAESFVERLDSGRSVSAPGRPPSPGSKPNLSRKLLDDDEMRQSVEEDRLDDETFLPNSFGTLNAHFSSSRIIPSTAGTAYPFRTVGKLFFTTDTGDAVCSASTISYRIVVTAGHCVHRGSGGTSGFYRNFMFVPAYRNGTAPFGTWNGSVAVVTNAWANGGGSVPNAADYAMLEMADRNTARIGDVTGFLGWRTNSLNPNHATMLGFPCNFDACAQMHQVAAGAFRNTVPNNVEYGSDARGGSSGGPWVRNFGVASSGQDSTMNLVVGVTSYGYASTDPKVQGASVPDDRWLGLWNALCARRGRNCAP